MSTTERERVALVTGGAREIGRAISVRLAADDIRVIVNYRTNRAAADEVVAKIKADGGQAIAVGGDVCEQAELIGLFDAAERHYGGLDILVNNAGTAKIVPFAEATDEDFDEMFAINARAAFVRG